MFTSGGRVLKIVAVGHPVLRQKSRLLTKAEILSREVQQLIGDMRLTMRKAPGVGLAAPQVGLDIQLVVIEDIVTTPPREGEAAPPPPPEDDLERSRVAFHVLINPRLKVIDETPREFFEGCLSVGDFRALVTRVRGVRVRALDERAQPVEIEAFGWYARIVQHEVDHLNGVLCIDRMVSRSFTTVANLTEFWNDCSIAEVRRRLELE